MESFLLALSHCFCFAVGLVMFHVHFTCEAMLLSEPKELRDGGFKKMVNGGRTR